MRQCSRRVNSAMEQWHLNQRAFDVSFRYDLIVFTMAMYSECSDSEGEKLCFIADSDIGTAEDLDHDNKLSWISG